ncbi:MAG: hypothetical protein M1838_003797, partial [Thelocarpon superellum]
MAAVPALHPDTLVGVKVAIGGTNRRFKMPLRDLGANVLPEKLRILLNIPPNDQVVFERYSDSAASFIALDPNNPAVYKQLYRAAKAKLKLRIKATVTSATEQEPGDPTLKVESEDRKESLSGEDAVAATGNSTTHVPGSWAKYFDQHDHPRASLGPSSTDDTCHQYAHLLESHMARRDSSDSDAPVPHAFSAPRFSLDDLRRMERAQRWSMLNKQSVVYMPEAANASGSRSQYSVFCNACDAPIPDAHYHCSICDGGDFDLCRSCVDAGTLCADPGHWLIRRFIQDGRVINSTTERTAPRKPIKEEAKEDEKSEVKVEPTNGNEKTLLTCNSCVEVAPMWNFVSCANCEDYDLCIKCVTEQKHGHHPGHHFEPASPEARLDAMTLLLCEKGRNVSHFALCDGCDQSIRGVRHKCLDCPDWDYCSTCIPNASYLHPGHRFAPIFEPINAAYGRYQAHTGISCDGPLCVGKGGRAYIVGDRYKCAVCHDTDFCGSCEASPINRHNRTHPLIKFKTPVKNVTVATDGEKENGDAMPEMGDYHARTRSAATETTPTPTAASANAATQVQIVADLKPSRFSLSPRGATYARHPSGLMGGATSFKPVGRSTEASVLMQAHFVKDSVPDGTQVPRNHIFTQTWTLANTGMVPWPRGCLIKFVGGDNMRNVDPAHPSSVADLERSTESNIVEVEELKVGEHYDFSVTLRAPSRPGKAISYWRMTSPDGEKFGDRLWCDVDVTDGTVVEAPKMEAAKVEETEAATASAEAAEPTGSAPESSTMIFPTLEKESPMNSTHEATTGEDDEHHLASE